MTTATLDKIAEIIEKIRELGSRIDTTNDIDELLEIRDQLIEHKNILSVYQTVWELQNRNPN